MEVISIQKIQDRPIIDAIATNDFLLIGDTSDGNTIKRVTLSSLRAFVLDGLPTSTPTPTPTPSFNTRYLGINCGGNQFIDSEGDEWIADNYFNQISGETGNTSGDILGTVDDGLFHTDRHGDFSYVIPTLDNSIHQVSLHFCEPYWQELDSRKFRVRINNILVINNFDIFADVGFKTALVKIFEVVPVNQQVEIVFQTINDNAIVNAILVKK